MAFFRDLAADFRRTAEWRYQSKGARAVAKAVLAEGACAMLLYRLMQCSRRWRLGFLAMLFGRLNSLVCRCTIGRGTDFGPGFVLLHPDGVVINGAVRGGKNVILEHQVTLGEAKGQNPKLGSDIYIGAGAKVLGGITIGDGARIGANAVVVRDVPPHATVVGVPARVVRIAKPGAAVVRAIEVAESWGSHCSGRGSNQRDR
jgi:serine O-acetyltransferase